MSIIIREVYPWYCDTKCVSFGKSPRNYLLCCIHFSDIVKLENLYEIKLINTSYTYPIEYNVQLKNNIYNENNDISYGEVHTKIVIRNGPENWNYRDKIKVIVKFYHNDHDMTLTSDEYEIHRVL